MLKRFPLPNGQLHISAEALELGSDGLSVLSAPLRIRYTSVELRISRNFTNQFCTFAGHEALGSFTPDFRCSTLGVRCSMPCRLWPRGNHLPKSFGGYCGTTTCRPVIAPSAVKHSTSLALEERARCPVELGPSRRFSVGPEQRPTRN